MPVVMLRGDGQMNPDGVRDYDLLVPATVEALVAERHARRRERLRPRPRRGGGAHPRARRRRAAPARREGAPPAGRPGGGPGRGRDRRRRSGRAASILLGRRATTTPTRSPTTLARRVDGAADLPRRRGPDEPLARSTSAARRSSSRQFTLYADTRRGRRPGFTGAAPPELAERLYERFAAALRALGVPRRDGPVRRGDGGRARQRRPVHDLAR